MATQAVKPTAAKKKRALRQNTKPLLLIALPGILYLLINNYLPMIGIFLAFKDYSYIKGPFKSNWCGFKNFEFLFRSDAAFTMIRNTLAYNVVFIITTTVLAITLAIMMNELNKLTISKFFQGSLLLPNLVSMVIVSYLVYAFLNPESGLLNNTMELLHLPTVNWYSEPKYWPMILVIVNAWKNAGYASIVYIGSIAGIDPSLYEAARIDGASNLRIFLSIGLPLAKVGLVTIGLFTLLGYWNDFQLSLYLVNNSELFPVQKMLYTMMANISFLVSGSVDTSVLSHAVLPTNTAKMVMTVLTVLPVAFVFPLAQKYFVKGITVGAVKG